MLDEAGTTRAMLPVANWRTHTLEVPLSDCTYASHLPSLEIAGTWIFPEDVTGLIIIIHKIAFFMMTVPVMQVQS